MEGRIVEEGRKRGEKEGRGWKRRGGKEGESKWELRVDDGRRKEDKKEGVEENG